ncbi:lipoyl synthase [bacterium]|nr:lipoyl synthase [bacterium]
MNIDNELPIIKKPAPVLRKPDWLKTPLGHNKQFHETRQLVQGSKLFTVCEEAACPNMGECWSRGTATIMIMGDTCTRSCGFCNVKTGRPQPLDPDEPRRVGEALKEFGLKYIVITSVDRDELPDAGAGHFAEVMRACREISPSTRLEVLVPDFKGMPESVKLICDEKPNVYAHNMETVNRLHPQVRPQAKYYRSLDTLGQAKQHGMVVKSGIMVGLGETQEEVIEVMRDLVEVGCDLLTIGQYMQPTPRHLPVIEYIHPDIFKYYSNIGKELGLKHVEAGPLVRSSYRAETQEAILRSGNI